MTQSLNHWTRDEELLERYVLGRVVGDELLTIERHLKECEECRLRVQHERGLIAGVKRFGREEMKERLRQRVLDGSPTLSTGVIADASQRSDSPKPREIQLSWQTIVSIAAVILILTGIGIYNNWFFSKPSMEGSLHQRAEETELKPEAAGIDEPSKPKVGADALSQPDKRDAGEKSGGLALKDRGLGKEENVSVRKRQQRVESPVELAKALHGSAGAGGPATEKKSSFDEKSGGEEWIQGTLIAGSLRSERNDLQGMPLVERQRSALKSQQKDRTQATSRDKSESDIKHRNQVVQFDTLTQTFELSQRPLSMLAKARQSGQLPQQVPTSVKANPSTIFLQRDITLGLS